MHVRLIDSDWLIYWMLIVQGEQTYTPRLIAVDRSGSLGSLKQAGTLYDVITPPIQELEQGDLAWWVRWVCVPPFLLFSVLWVCL